MEHLVQKEEVWVATMEDTPGALANKLAGLADAGADLGLVIARRTHDKPSIGVVFVTPIRGDREVEAATELGFSVSKNVHALCVEGENRPGIAVQLAEKIGKAGLNLRGFTGAVIGTRFVVHIGFDSEADMRKAERLLAAS
ncbi:MAG: amino acid-binding protein [Verrucomicrobia bacterium]|nr:amino acid-binding protein [Verrucomicrobiota bacterium]